MVFKGKNMNINFETNEISFILQVLGELPTKSGAYVLMQKIEHQVKMQQQVPETTQ
jgi:deferrochelatase/peroxidase EfeB